MRPSESAALPEVGYETGAGVRVDDGETLQEIVDLVRGDSELEDAVVDVRVALVVRDAVPVDDDAPERRVGVDECRGACAA